MSAVIASILELPAEAVPDFGGDDVFYENIARFLEPMGLYYVQAPIDDSILKVMFRNASDKHPIYHTVEGLSPRGRQHACVGRNGKIVFDPHPQDGTGRGLAKPERYGLLCERFD